MTGKKTLEKFGFKFGQSGAHSARSMMLEEQQTLFQVTPIDATQEQYKADICDYNLLDKPTSGRPLWHELRNSFISSISQALGG